MNHREGWFGLELRHLAALSAVARERSFRGAADSLGYVQSSVSEQIAALERLVGVRLIDRCRGSKEIRVTPVGELLVEHAEEILARVRAARADLASRSQERADPSLRLGVSPGVASRLLAELLGELTAGAPWLRVEPRESVNDAAVFDLIERGEIDVAFTDFPLPSGAFESRTIARDPCSLLVRAGSDLASELEPPTVDRLARTPLVMLDGARSTAALETWFAAQGAVPNVALRATGEATLRAFVAAGLAGAIVPRLAVEPWDERIVAIDLEGVVPDREIAIYWRTGGVDGKVLAAFSEAATKVTSGNPAGAGGGRVELAAA